NLVPLTHDPQLKNYPIIDAGHLIHDFSDTAAIISHLDLLISIDSAPIHVAGALEKPCWLLLSKVHDWRWSMNSDKSLWYPSLQLFRQQNSNDWGDVMRNIDDSLDKKFPNKCGWS
uniref:glycosyltransferase family 9 protein n=1 Tax=Facilibium subflavum TaxID=2219058 RepID=UPI0013C32FA8